MSGEPATPVSPDPPCALTGPRGDWCERHRTRHPEGSKSRALSQDPGPAGERFRVLNDRLLHAPWTLGAREEVTVAAAPAGPCPNWGPGTELKEIAAGFGRTERAGCGCAKLMCEMDQAGAEAIRADLSGWAKRLRANAKAYRWAEYKDVGARAAARNEVEAGLKAVASGVVSKSWRHVFDWDLKYREMIEEACRRAEAKGPKPELPRGAVVSAAGTFAAGQPADPPCALSLRDGTADWCERHGERHPAGTKAGELSQDAGPAGARFRKMRDLLRLRNLRVEAAAPKPAAPSPREAAQLKLAEAAQSVAPSAPPRPHGAPLRWAVGLTTVPSRRWDLLPRTLKSLENAGFSGESAPRLFVDGDPGPWDELPNEATFRFPSFARRTPAGESPCPWANWWLGMQELFMRCPDCDRYAMFQDDLEAPLNLRAYLEASPFPERGYLNLFAFMNNEALASALAGEPGWVEAAALPAPSSLSGAALEEWQARGLQCGRGALALVFDREGLVELLRFKDAVERPLEHPALRGLARIDGGVVDSMNKLGRREWTHRPSLVQHTGSVSAVSRRPNPETRELEPKRWRIEALTFPGEGFDCMSLLKAPATTEAEEAR